MFLIANLRIHSLDSSSLSADLQWISFVLKSALWKVLYQVCKICITLYNDDLFFPGNALSIKPQTTPK